MSVENKSNNSHVLICFLSFEFSIIKRWLERSKSEMLISRFSYIFSRVSFTSRNAAVCLVKCYKSIKREYIGRESPPILIIYVLDTKQHYSLQSLALGHLSPVDAFSGHPPAPYFAPRGSFPTLQQAANL